MKKYWTTKEGEEIEYKNIQDSHLVNILKFVEKRAKEGIMVISGAGSCPEDFWYDEHEINGAEVLAYYDYKGLKEEAGRRDLINPSELK